VLAAMEARALLDSIDPSSVVGLRDRGLIALMVYAFARVGAATKMRVADVYVQARRTRVRLHERGGKRHEMPCHHNLEAYLQAYIERAEIAGDKKSFLFRTANWHTGRLSSEPMTQPDAYRMIRRRATAAGILTKIGNHSFRATGITEYLKNGGKLEIAQQMANHDFVGNRSSNV
jgi:site-specific recombinase XerD